MFLSNASRRELKAKVRTMQLSAPKHLQNVLEFILARSCGLEVSYSAMLPYVQLSVDTECVLRREHRVCPLWQRPLRTGAALLIHLLLLQIHG